MRELLERAPESAPPLGYNGLLRLYGSNAGIADAAGFPTAAGARRAYREAHPRARRATLEKVGATARRRRQSFLRNLQRYADGSRHPRALTPLLNRLREEGIRRRELVTTLAGLARLMEELGVTVLGSSGFWVWVSRDYRYRDGLPDVPIDPELLEGFAALVDRGEWAEAAELFFDAWGQSYGIGHVEVDEVQYLELELGS